MQYQGVINRVLTKTFNNKTFYTLTLRGQDGFYNTGVKRPPSEGTSVKFEANPNAKGYLQVDDKSLVIQTEGPVGIGTAQQAANGSSRTMSKDDYWRRREERDVSVQERIERQSCRNSAIALVAVMLDKEAIKLGAEAKREGIIQEIVERYTNQFITANKGVEVSTNPVALVAAVEAVALPENWE